MDKSTLYRLYVRDGKSMMQIAEALNCSQNKVSIWMKKYDIPRRSHSDASYLKHNPGGDPFCIKHELSADEKYLKGVGLGIYWGEGNKMNPTSARVGNSDPRLLQVYIRFLRVICGVHENRIMCGLQVFSDIDPEVALQYWMKSLNLSRQ